MNIRPALCRERLREEGKPYPRSKCQACGWTAFSGPIERAKCEDRMPQQPPAASDGCPTDDTDYSKEPVSISTLKAQRSEKAHDWTARDALIDVLREIDGEKLNIDAVFIVYRIRDEDGKWSTKFRQRTPDFHTSIGMIEHIKHRILSDD